MGNFLSQNGWNIAVTLLNTILAAVCLALLLRFLLKK